MQRTETSGRVDISPFLSNGEESIHQFPSYIQADSAGNVGQRILQWQYDRFVQTLINIIGKRRRPVSQSRQMYLARHNENTACVTRIRMVSLSYNYIFRLGDVCHDRTHSQIGSANAIAERALPQCMCTLRAERPATRAGGDRAAHRAAARHGQSHAGISRLPARLR